MGETARIAPGFGRRRWTRLQLGMPARLIMPDGTVPVVLENMSLGGARIMLAVPDEFVVCVLRWMDYHAFADVVWREDLSVGLQFDKPLSLAMLEATRLYAEGVPARVRPGEVALRSC
jgi:hypothetical protein